MPLLVKVQLTVRNRPSYSYEDGFRNVARGKVIPLSLRQDRNEQGKEFCENCFDFGASTTPDECVRCRVILGLHNTGHGDCRKIRIPLPRSEGRAQPIAFFLLLLLWWWTLCQWTAASLEAERLRVEVAAYRRRNAPPPKRKPL